MKLTFFEKELFDSEAIEKPTISVNSISPAQTTAVQKITTKLANGAYISEPKNKRIRTIKIPAEFVNFFTDGTKFYGRFKHTKLTSGEAEIVSRTTAPQITKPINVSFKSTARLRALEETAPNDVQVSHITYQPYFIVNIGNQIKKVFMSGFDAVNSFVSRYNTLAKTSSRISLYNAFVNFITTTLSGTVLSESTLFSTLRKDTPESRLPSEIASSETESTITPVTVSRRVVNNDFNPPLTENHYWKLTGKIKNRFSYKDFCLAQNASSLITPVSQKVSFDGMAEWVNGGTGPTAGQPRTSPYSQDFINSIPTQRVVNGNFAFSMESAYKKGVLILYERPNGTRFAESVIDKDATELTRSDFNPGRFANPPTAESTVAISYAIYSYVAKLELSGPLRSFLERYNMIEGLNSEVGSFGGDVWRPVLRFPITRLRITQLNGNFEKVVGPGSINLSLINPRGTYNKYTQFNKGQVIYAYLTNRGIGVNIRNISNLPEGILFINNFTGVPSKSELDNQIMSRYGDNLFISQVVQEQNTKIDNLRNATIGPEVPNQNQRPEPPTPPMSNLRPVTDSDFTTPPEITPQDLGIDDTSIKVNNVSLPNVRVSNAMTPTQIGGSSVVNTDENTRSRILYYKVNTSSMRTNAIPLLASDNSSNDTPPGTTELQTQFPVSLSSGGDNSYDIVFIDFDTNEVYISKNDGKSGLATGELTAISVEKENGDIEEISFIGSLQRRGSYDGKPVGIITSQALADYFRPTFKDDISAQLSRFNGVRLPLLIAWASRANLAISRVMDLLSSRIGNLRFLITASGQDVVRNREQTQDLLEEGVRLPNVHLNNILYDTAENRIIIILTRAEQSPVPDKNYFSSVNINNRSFSFGSSKYVAYNDANSSPYGVKGAEYSWRSPVNIIQGLNNIPIEFKKSGTSYTNPIDISRLVRKSTVRTTDKKDFTKIISGLEVADIGFSSTSLYIEFKGNVSVDAFQTFSLKSSHDPNASLEDITSGKVTTQYITRQLLLSDANRTEAGGRTKFEWTGYSEFEILSPNKDYVIEILRGANTKESRLFVPIQSKENFNFVQGYRQGRDTTANTGNIAFNLQRTTFSTSLRDSFVAFALLNRSDERVLSGKWFDNADFSYNDDIQTFDTGSLSNVPAPPAVGTKVYLAFRIDDRDSTEITITKLTDILADTIVCLDTNIDDLNLIDGVTNNPLAHESDYEAVKEVTEGGLRHVFIKLKQPITARQLRLVVRKTRDNSDAVRINRMLILKTIGCFSQFPKVRVNTNTEKTDESSALNTAHVTSKPLSLNYTLEFPPLTKVRDLELAQDIFSRASEYNEFIIWLSGGDIAPKIANLIGYRFIDLVKSLAINDFTVEYVDGRVSSGVGFTLDTKQVSRLNI